MEWDGGLPPASPMPTPIRASASCQKPAARPQNAVMTDHTVIEMTRIHLRLWRSASRAMGMPSVA
jgi:hypothetical protein